jgi:hypothetical protein
VQASMFMSFKRQQCRRCSRRCKRLSPMTRAHTDAATSGALLGMDVLGGALFPENFFAAVQALD